MEKEFLVELSIKQLHQSAVSAYPDTKKRQNALDEVRINAVKFVPMQNALMIKMSVRNIKENKDYLSTILFEGVVYEREDTPNNVTFVGSDGQDYHVAKINSTQTQVQVQCTCLDMQWRFQKWNKGQNAGLGDLPPPYQKKTNRPDVNPTKSPGICKHLMKGVEHLKQLRLLD